MTKIEDIIEVLEVFRDYKWKGEYTSTEEQREQYNREIKDVKQMKEYIIKETAKDILVVLQELYDEAQKISRKDVIYRIGAVDALQNAIDTIRKKFGMEGE